MLSGIYGQKGKDMTYLQLIKSHCRKSNKDIALAFGYNPRTFERYMQTWNYPKPIEVMARMIWFKALSIEENYPNKTAYLDRLIDTMIEQNKDIE